jgi:hypothetical protein
MAGTVVVAEVDARCGVEWDHDSPAIASRVRVRRLFRLEPVGEAAWMRPGAAAVVEGPWSPLRGLHVRLRWPARVLTAKGWLVDLDPGSRWLRRTEVEREFGPHPSDVDRDFHIYVMPGPMGGYGGIARIPRRPLSVRKADAFDAIGVRADGAPVNRGHPAVDVYALFDHLPQALWPLLPLAVLGGVILIVGASVTIGLALS